MNRGTLALVAAALLVNTAAAASYVTLTGGKSVNLRSAGKLTDKGIIKVVKEPNLAGTLPSPLCPAASSLHLITDLDDVTYTLDCGGWIQSGNGYTYLDKAGTHGVQKILFTSGRATGELKIRLGGSGYAQNPLGGPITFVEVSLAVGATPYCGRFAAPASTIATNDPGAVLVRGPSTTCLSPPPTPGVPAGTTAATVTVTASPTQDLLPTSTRPPPPSRTPKLPPPPSTPTPTIGPNMLNYSCARLGDKNPKVADKVAAQTLRWLRDWSNCLRRNGYGGSACEVHLGAGINFAAVLKSTGKPLLNELVCNNFRCTHDLGRSLEHCNLKFGYETSCSLDDWNKVWQWVGDPPLLSSGKCAVTGADCVSDADCGGNSCQAPSVCDVYKYGNSAWEPCRCIQEAFIKPQIDEWLAEVRALNPPPTNRCANEAFNAMGEAIGPMIETGCTDPTDVTCLAAINRCEAQWDAVTLIHQCGTCQRGPDLSCPASCPGAQIPCDTWMSWCASAKARFDPLRLGTRASAQP
jgi:hypothetical protein